MTKHGHRSESMNPTIDLCAGGTASAGSTTITFTNHRPHSCTINGLGSLVDCGNSFSVPANSSKTCNILSNATAGTYPYSSPCCGGPDTNPVIIMQ